MYSRTSNLIRTRKDLIRQRRETGIKTRLQKDQINKVMEQVRTDAGKANKIIKLVMSGQGTISSLTTSLIKSPSPHKTSPKQSQSSTSVLSNGALRHSKSANAAGFERSGGPTFTYQNDTQNSIGPQAYVSPYASAPAKELY